VFWAGVGGKSAVALAFVVLLHLVNRISIDGIRGIEEPGALGAGPALKVGRFDPNEFTTHAYSISGRLKKGDNIEFL
jgi:hypothetical protein